MYFLLAFYFYKGGRFWIYFLILFHKTIPLQNSSYNLSFLNIFVPLWYETEVFLS